MNVYKKFVGETLVVHTINGVDQIGAHQSTVKEWPLWAKALKQYAKPEDKGIGDIVARAIGAENSKAFKTWYLVTFGKSCGCAGRQARWNRQYPL